MKILVNDIETYKELFLNIYFLPEEGRYYRFEVSRWKNELDAMMKFIESHLDYYIVTYNGLSFDAQVIEWVLRNHQNWYDLTGLEIAAMIAQKANDRIDDANYDVFPEYREQELVLKQVDLFTIWHFNNRNRSMSLKALEFYLNLPNIDETPVPFDKKGLTREDAVQVINYCKNDVFATYKFYLLTRGIIDDEDSNSSLYKGEDKIADRLIMKEEFGLDCLNWDDVKIGAEWNKMDYIALTGRKERDLKPKKIRHFYGKRFGQFFPKHIEFQTKELRDFIKDFGNTFIINKKQEFRYKFNNELTATIAKGGIHSNEKGRFIRPLESEVYYQCDIGSQYPNGIRKYKVEPAHLPGWNGLIVTKIDRRLNYKHQYQETGDPRFNSMQKMGKLSLNGGSYGRLNTKGDWQEYPYGMLQVTIGGQLELMMIVEDLILKGFRVVSLNTDGFDAIIPRRRDKEFRNILTEWEKVIGNDTLGKFEYTEFQWIAQTSVNDYLALTSKGKIKAKGDFEIYKEAHKNPSARIVPIALKAYYKDDVPIEETIKNHKNIYDFAIRQKSSKDFHYEGVVINTKYPEQSYIDSEIKNNWYQNSWWDRKTYWLKKGGAKQTDHFGGYSHQEMINIIVANWRRESGKKTVYNKLIRYYVSNAGEKLFKIKNPECTTNAAPVSQVEAGDWLMTVCNYLPKNTPTDNVDFSYYIQRANKIVDKIKYSGRKQKTEHKDQLSLF